MKCLVRGKRNPSRMERCDSVAPRFATIRDNAPSRQPIIPYPPGRASGWHIPGIACLTTIIWSLRDKLTFVLIFTRTRVRGTMARPSPSVLKVIEHGRDVGLPPRQTYGESRATPLVPGKAQYGRSNQYLVSHAAVRIHADMRFGIKVIGESGLDLARLVEFFYLFH
jgi:hypothetical protein